MHARVTHTKGPADSVDQATKVIREQVIPTASQIPGYKGIITFANRETGEGWSATFWESADAMAASDEAADAMRGQAIGDIPGSEVVDVTRWEVTVDERA